jgi:two-component system, chemotaxis family, protein-glutamate methylesterase/glutaminase
MVELIRVLVIDDSAYVRKVVSQMLSRSPFIQVVGIARDGQEGLELTKELAPDVITCDLNMPVMDGVSFVQAQMASQPIPIVIISIAAESGEQVLAALDAGAVDFVQKPTALATEKLGDIALDLTEKVKAAGSSRGRRIVAAGAPAPPVATTPHPARGTYDVVVIGVSTGGPQGLKAVIPRIPTDFRVPIAMVLHMPIGYTQMYAQKLDALSPLHVVEAVDAEEVRAGTVYLAPAGRHLLFRRDKEKVLTRLDIRPLDSPHRPSVDALFQSAAEVYGGRTLGIVMTGMGSDGREGAAWIKAQGGCILTEAEETCVVYGMPRSVVDAGLSDERVPLDQIARAIMERV